MTREMDPAMLCHTAEDCIRGRIIVIQKRNIHRETTFDSNSDERAYFVLSLWDWILACVCVAGRQLGDR